jgi:hypothetical protein
VVPCKSRQRRQSVRNDDAGKTFRAIAAIRHDQRATGPRSLDITQEAVPIGARSIKRDEEVAGARAPAIGYHAANRSVTIPNQFPADSGSHTSEI